MKAYFKKIISCLLLAFVFFTGINTVPKAAENSSNEKIDQMFNKAVSDYNKKLSKSQTLSNDDTKYLTVTDNNGKKFLVKAFKYEDGTKRINENEYVETYVVSTEKEYVKPVSNNGNISTMNVGSNEEWDSSISVKTYINLTYNKKPGTNYYLLTNVSGGWSISDKSVSVSDRQVITVCRDILNSKQHTLYNPTSNTFNYSTGYTNYVESTSASSILGASTSATLKRGTKSTWKFEFAFTIFNNASTPDIS